MEMRKTSVWVSRFLSLLFVFSSFSHLAEANSSKSQIVQKKVNNSQVSGSTGRMVTIGRTLKKHWYVLAAPVIIAAGYVASQLKNNSTEQKNESNSVVRKPEQPGAAQEEQQRSVDSSVGNAVGAQEVSEQSKLVEEGSLVEASVSVDAQKETQPKRLITFEDEAGKPIEPKNIDVWSEVIDMGILLGVALEGYILTRLFFGWSSVYQFT